MKLVLTLFFLFCCTSFCNAAFAVHKLSPPPLANQQQAQCIKTQDRPFVDRGAPDPFATVALVSALAGLVVFTLPLGLLAIVTALLALADDKGHKRRAFWGLLLGLLDVTLVMLVAAPFLIR